MTSTQTADERPLFDFLGEVAQYVRSWLSDPAAADAQVAVDAQVEAAGDEMRTFISGFCHRVLTARSQANLDVELRFLSTSKLLHEAQRIIAMPGYAEWSRRKSVGNLKPAPVKPLKTLADRLFDDATRRYEALSRLWDHQKSLPGHRKASKDDVAPAVARLIVCEAALAMASLADTIRWDDDCLRALWTECVRTLRKLSNLYHVPADRTEFALGQVSHETGFILPGPTWNPTEAEADGVRRLLSEPPADPPAALVDIFRAK